MTERCLYDSAGFHIANVVYGQLHSVTGQNIGHPAPSGRYFFDMEGHYLGEIVDDDRLLNNLHSPYQGVSHGVYGDYGFVGDFGNPGSIGSMGLGSGYGDIPREKLGLRPARSAARR